jgi:methionyl-tRNA synthetase
MSKFKRTLITSALPYANGPVHIGHLAGVYVPADIYARYLRLKGEEVLFVGGSDEHGVPITLKAKNEGITPQDVVDKYHAMIKDSFERFGISFDVYSRTSAPVHYETASGFFKKLYETGKFLEKSTEQYYDEENQQFLADRYIVGTCPKCGFERAYGDQCESCGTSLSPTELISPRSMLSGNTPVLRETRHWYLPLDEYEPWLREWILEGHTEWKPNVYGQCKSWIDSGLLPRAVTRDLDWGVPVPLENAQGKVLYVWFDAPIGYISATREFTPQWEKYWKDPETRLLHFIGKDNIVFHCIIFPVMLKAEGSYILPENVPANEFLNLEGDKISTSRNWAVWLHEYLDEFPGKEDVLKYALTANAPETKDNDFTWKDFQARNNNELVAILGNFVNRAMVLTEKYFKGVVPSASDTSVYDEETLSAVMEIRREIEKSLSGFRFREALKNAMEIARLGNKYLADEEPWKVIKTDPERVKTVLNVCLQLTASLTIALEPFLPGSMDKLRSFLNLEKLGWENLGRKDLMVPGAKLNPSYLLFEKIEDAVIDRQVQKLLDIRKSNEMASVMTAQSKDNITYDQFDAIDIRTGTVIEAERVPKTKKLLRLKIDTGIDQRTVVSGIAEYYSPEELIGQQLCILVNLEPKSLKGIESKGMILCAQDADGKLVIVTPKDLVRNGSEVK